MFRRPSLKPRERMLKSGSSRPTHSSWIEFMLFSPFRLFFGAFTVVFFAPNECVFFRPTFSFDHDAPHVEVAAAVPMAHFSVFFFPCSSFLPVLSADPTCLFEIRFSLIVRVRLLLVATGTFFWKTPLERLPACSGSIPPLVAATSRVFLPFSFQTLLCLALFHSIFES